MSPSIEKLLFAAASGFADAEERRVFLDHACGGDPVLRKKLDELLAIRNEAEDFFEFQPEVDDPGAPAETAGEEGLGTLIGRYRLIERIGEGGCGVVYLAEQQEPVRRKVALKIIRLGMDTENVIARFEAERQALALMHHPNIAHVLDAGATATGRPYFVMELVDGEKISEFCDRNRMDLRGRLELFIQVCQAIQHAHQKGVIHRDIKPSNVLVRLDGGIPVPKVIDFGIAKATTENPGLDVTHLDQFLGTPAYMSPEQAAGGMDVDTRSDIYSLGALLYELLVGRPPFEASRFKDRSAEDVRRVLREEEPLAPSAAIEALPGDELENSAAARGVPPQRLSSQLTGDLDWIVMKALEKDRQRRYVTANGLAMDVRRYLNQEPIHARPPSRSYRLQKLIRRNMALFASGGVAAFGLLAGFGVSTWLFLREKDAREEQVRLRNVAEEARANEVMLREKAQTAEKVSRAAVLLRDGGFAQADDLLAGLSAEETPVSLESANTFKALAEWHLRSGRWNEASDRFNSLAYVITSVDLSDTDRASRDLLPAAAALCASGKPGQYDRFRRMAIQRFSHTSHPVVAEQILKAGLLLPADEAMLESLEPLAEIAETSLLSRDREENDAYMKAWRTFSISLWYWRRGDARAAASWARRSLASSDQTPSRVVLSKLVLAMAEAGSEGAVPARNELSEARAAIDRWFSEFSKSGGVSRGGLWSDWVSARILLKEAETRMETGKAE